MRNKSDYLSGYQLNAISGNLGRRSFTQKVAAAARATLEIIAFAAIGLALITLSMVVFTHVITIPQEKARLLEKYQVSDSTKAAVVAKVLDCSLKMANDKVTSLAAVQDLRREEKQFRAECADKVQTDIAVQSVETASQKDSLAFARRILLN